MSTSLSIQGQICGLMNPLSFLCTLVLFAVVTARECCLQRYGDKLYCDSDEYCCNSLTFPDGSNLRCCSSFFLRASSVYIEENCYPDSYDFPVWGIVLLVIGLFFALVCGIALYCCCRKSKGFSGTVNSPGRTVSHTGPAITPSPQQPAYNAAHGAFYTSSSAQPETTPTWSMAPPSYADVIAQDNANKVV